MYVLFETLQEMLDDTEWPVGTMAQVTADPVPEARGIYERSTDGWLHPPCFFCGAAL